MPASAISPKKMFSRLSFHKHLIQTKSRRNMRIQLQPQKTRTARSMMKKKTQAPAGTIRCKVVWDGFFGIAANVQRIFLNSCLFHMQKFRFQRLHLFFFSVGKTPSVPAHTEGWRCERERKQGSLAFTKMEFVMTVVNGLSGTSIVREPYGSIVPSCAMVLASWYGRSILLMAP